MSSLLTGETASDNRNVAKVFAGENANADASAQMQRDFKPPSLIFPPMKVMKVKQVPQYREIDMGFGNKFTIISGYKTEVIWE
jgi:hypothetical protein